MGPGGARDGGRAHVVHFIQGLGLGGDAKNLVSLAREQAGWAKVTVITCDARRGERSDSLGGSIARVVGVTEPGALAAWMAEHDGDCLFFHRPGPQNDWETAFLRPCAERGIATFEYNTFGRVDASTDALWTGHLHLCRATLVQYARRLGASPLGLEAHLAAGYSVEEPAVAAAEERREARARLGIPADALVGVRLMRPDLRKWDGIPVLGARHARDRGGRAHLVLREAPPERASWARRLLGDAVTLLPATTDATELRATLAAADVLLNYSTIGETFGLALAEGMAMGLVPVVNSTPEVDNAQIELCEHGVTGLVANGAGPLADALLLLEKSPALRASLGAAARASILARFAAPVVERRIRRFVIARLRATGNPAWSRFPDPGPDDGYTLDAEWLARHEQAAGTSFRATPFSFADVVDDARIQATRLVDGARFARKIGPRNALRAVASRLKRGSLRRA